MRGMHAGADNACHDRPNDHDHEYDHDHDYDDEYGNLCDGDWPPISDIKGGCGVGGLVHGGGRFAICGEGVSIGGCGGWRKKRRDVGIGGYGWVVVGTGWYWWVLVGTGGYRWVPVGTSGYGWVLEGTGGCWLSLSITLLQT